MNCYYPFPLSIFPFPYQIFPYQILLTFLSSSSISISSEILRSSEEGIGGACRIGFINSFLSLSGISGIVVMRSISAELVFPASICLGFKGIGGTVMEDIGCPFLNVDLAIFIIKLENYFGKRNDKKKKI